MQRSLYPSTQYPSKQHNSRLAKVHLCVLLHVYLHTSRHLLPHPPPHPPLTPSHAHAASAHAPPRRRRTACAAQSPTSTVDNADQPPLSTKAALSASKDVVDAGKEAFESSKDDVLETAAAAGDALSSAASSAATTAAQRLRKLSASASEDRPYAAPNALSLARRRALQKWLPYRWAETARRVLENIPAQQFSYLQSTGAILFTAVTAFGVAYASWPAAHSAVLWAFAAGGPEARNMQVPPRCSLPPPPCKLCRPEHPSHEPFARDSVVLTCTYYLRWKGHCRMLFVCRSRTDMHAHVWIWSGDCART